jgi:hypothetical protein
MEPISSLGSSKNPITIAGLDEMVKAFRELGESTLEDIRPNVDKAGDIVLEKTREKVRQYKKYSQYDTLERSLYLKRPKGQKYAYFNVLTWGDDARDHGAPLELGHDIRFQKRGKIYGRVKAHPFMRPGADESADNVFNEIVSGMDKILNNMGSRTSKSRRSTEMDDLRFEMSHGFKPNKW